MSRCGVHDALVLVGCIIWLGCGGCSPGEPTYVVRGEVTYKERPISGGAINFYPPQGRPLGGPISRDGTYEFELPAGEYRVAINAPPPIPEGWKEGDPVPQTEAPLPPHYARPESSGLTLTVSEDDAPLTRDFELP